MKLTPGLAPVNKSNGPAIQPLKSSHTSSFNSIVCFPDQPDFFINMGAIMCLKNKIVQAAHSVTFVSYDQE